MIKLVSKEWQEFIVEESVAKVSGFIKESIYHGSNIITLDNTKAEVLEKAAHYLCVEGLMDSIYEQVKDITGCYIP
ncbi:hypothetical protein AAC387_Pa10g0378 [Persea americana]